MNKRQGTDTVVWIGIVQNDTAQDEGGDVLFLVNTWLVILAVLGFLFVTLVLGVNPLPFVFGILDAIHRG